MSILHEDKFVGSNVAVTPGTVPDGSPLNEEIRRVAAICDRAALGDLEARISGIDRETDLGRLSNSINHMLDMADSFVREASAAMKECSDDRFHRPILLDGLKGAYRQSSVTLNKAGIKMQDSQQRLIVTGQLASDTAASVATVAAACEEMNSSNSEIARQASASARQTETAVDQSQQVSVAVKNVNQATQKIESIVTLINRIAGQTNLLALNATIEAARAGEHGRGFAVVANEVKELARSSAKATEDIAQHIESMRSTVTQVMSLMDSVNNSIQTINHGASAIAQSVKEQVQATNDISRHITQVSEKTNEISASIAEATKTGR